MVPRCTLTGGPAGSAWVPERGRARPAVRRGCRIRWVCRSAPHRSAIRCIDGPGRPVVRGFIRWCRQQGPGVSRGAGPWRGSGSSGRRSADPFAGPGLPEADGCASCRASRKCSGHCENLVRQARSARRWARAAFFTRCPAGSPPRGLPAGYGSAWCSGSAGPVSAARAWIRGVPRRRSRVPTGRRPPRWYASSTPRCA
jgi:hypothetical protein